jgi:hypothetical protein
VAGFDVVRRTSLSADEAWRRVTDWERHGEFVPLTRVSAVQDPATGQVSFIARTAVGPVGFDDVMAVTHSQAPTRTEPGIVRIVKRGNVVLGWAVLTVTPTESGSEVRWHEEARLRWTRGPIVAVVDRVVARGFGRLLDGLLAANTSDGTQRAG